MGGGGGGSSDTVSDSFISRRKQISSSDLLTEEQKKDWLSKMNASVNSTAEKITNTETPYQITAGFGSVDEASTRIAKQYGMKLADLSKDIKSRKVYIQEQFNALNTAVNSRLQQTKITSFLGATAAKAAM